MNENHIERHRELLKSEFACHSPQGPSDQQQGVAYPPLQKPVPEDAQLIDLPAVQRSVVKKADIFDCIAERCSRRKFSGEPISLAELSFLLWATQGLKEVLGEGYATLRTVPSAGARHPFETYLIIHRVEGLAEGICRYLPLSHQLLHVSSPGALADRTIEACVGQKFAARCAVVFVWACVPYRAEWRYQSRAHKASLLDAGHIAQNLYLACEAIGCGTCAIAAYDQKAFDILLGLDGQDEMVVYLAPVGKL